MKIEVKPDYSRPAFQTDLDSFIEVNQFTSADFDRLLNLSPGQEVRINMFYGGFTVKGI